VKRRIKIKQTCLEEEVDPITPGSSYKTHYTQRTWLPSLTGKKCLILFCYDFAIHLLNMARFMVLFTIEFVEKWLKVDVVSSKKFRRDLEHPWHDLVMLGACFGTSKVVAWFDWWQLCTYCIRNNESWGDQRKLWRDFIWIWALYKHYLTHLMSNLM